MGVTGCGFLPVCAVQQRFLQIPPLVPFHLHAMAYSFYSNHFTPASLAQQVKTHMNTSFFLSICAGFSLIWAAVRVAFVLFWLLLLLLSISLSFFFFFYTPKKKEERERERKISGDELFSDRLLLHCLFCPIIISSLSFQTDSLCTSMYMYLYTPAYTCINLMQRAQNKSELECKNATHHGANALGWRSI